MRRTWKTQMEQFCLSIVTRYQNGYKRDMLKAQAIDNGDEKTK